MDSPEAILVLLSDLHFGRDLFMETDGPDPDIVRWAKVGDGKIRSFLKNNLKRHDFAIVKNLPRYLRSLTDRERQSGFSGQDSVLYLILGDLADRPLGDSYKFLREYITRERYRTGDEDLEFDCAALNIPPARLVSIPGNHDKLFKTDLGLYEQQFLHPLGLPLEPKPQGCFVRFYSLGKLDFVFFHVEASTYATIPDRVDLSCRGHLAGGEISPRLHTSIMTKLSRLKRGESVDGVQVPNYGSSKKILMVHYAVDMDSVLDGAAMPEQLALNHACMRLDSLVDDLSGELQLVVHGHLHKPKLYKHGTVPVVAVSTTTRNDSEEQRGFFVVKFYRSGDMRAEHHKWCGSGFLPDPSPDLNKFL